MKRSPLRRKTALTAANNSLKREKGLAKKSKKYLEKKEDRVDYGKQMMAFFEQVWKERRHYCSCCGVYLGEEPLTIFMDHLLSKSKYPQLAFEPDNIFLVCFAHHQSKESGNPHPIHKQAIEVARLRFGV